MLQGLPSSWPCWPSTATVRTPRSRWRSRRHADCLSRAFGPPAGRSSRSTRWPLPATATATPSPARSQTPSTPRPWPTFCGPTWPPTGRCPRTPSSFRPSPSSPGHNKDAVWARGQAHNKPRSQLREFYPAILDAFAPHKHGLCSREARSILDAAPTLTLAAKLTRRRLQSLLKQAGRVRGIQAEAERLHEVFRRDYLHQLPRVEAALGHQTSALLRQLNTACDNADQLEEAVTQAFEEHPDAPVIRSFPGLAALTGARVLGEIGDDRTRFASAGALKAHEGSAPVTRASGKSCKVMNRKVKNQRLAAVGYVWAFVSLTRSPGARAHYDRRRAAGDRHVAAQRNLFNRVMGMLFHCLQNGHTYDETIAFPQSPNGRIAATA